jgi:hypothetical protein
VLPQLSDVVLDVSLAGAVVRLESVLPVAAIDWGHEREDHLEVDAAESHPHGVEVPSNDPGWGEESTWFDELYIKLDHQIGYTMSIEFFVY